MKLQLVHEKKSRKNDEISQNKNLPNRKCSVVLEKYSAHDKPDELDSSSDIDSQEIMLKITRNGSALARVRERFNEILRCGLGDIDVNSIECIMGCGKKKSTILLPCRHQHTCESCWFLWKVHQINNMTPVFLNDSVDDNELKPKCPYCKTGVDEAISASN